MTFDPKDRYGDFSIGLTVIAGNGNYRKFNTLVVKGYVISRIPEAEIRYPYALSAALRADNKAIGMRQLSRSDPKRTRQLRLLNTSANTSPCRGPAKSPPARKRCWNSRSIPETCRTDNSS